MPFPSILNFLIARLPLFLTVNLTPFLFTSLPVLIVNRAPYVSAGSDCDTLKKKLEADGVLESRNGYAVAKYGDKTVFLVAFGTFWGKVGDVLKVEFNQPISLGGEPASKEIYMMMFDTKAHEHTNYPA